MSTSTAEALQDAAATGREVDFWCAPCDAGWTAWVPEGEFPTADDAECPLCSGDGEEV